MKAKETYAKPSLTSAAKKPWTEPIVEVFEVIREDIINTSGNLDSYEPEEYNPWK